MKLWSFEFTRQGSPNGAGNEAWRENSNDRNFTSILWVIYLYQISIFVRGHPYTTFLKVLNKAYVMKLSFG